VLQSPYGPQTMANEKREDDTLREKAEELLKLGKAKPAPPDTTDMESLLHELSVHQVELEAQNENLRRAQTQAEEAQQHYSLLFHDAPVAYFVLDDQGFIKEVNSEGERLIDRPGSKLVGTRLSVYLSKDSLVTFRLHLEAVLATNERQRCEVVLRNWSTKEPVNVLVESASLSGPGENRVRSAFIDLTERRRAEEDIKLLKHSIDVHYDAAYWMDTDNRFIYVNDAACASLGYERDELLGKTIFDISPHRTEEAMKEFWERLREKGSLVYETSHRRKDGTEFPIELVVTHVSSNGSEYAFGFARDISEKKELEAQLRQAHKMEALGTLAGGIAHDFNNILAAVIGFTELIRDHAPKDSRDRHHAQRVLEAGIRGRELVQQMLTFSRQTEQGKKPLHVSPILNETVKFLRASMPSTIRIKVNVKTASDLVLGDPTQMHQVIMNLATNAAYAMREKGGTLLLELDDLNASPDELPVGVDPGPYLTLRVRDTGTGISPQIVEKIFDPFFTTKEVGEGTGLGLSVVLGIVKQMRGHVTAESTPGEGSVFTVYLPSVAGDSASGVARDEPIPTGTERVLFIDDEEALVSMGEELLASLGYEVAGKANVREALALFRLDPSRFDLVVTDQTMPEMTGVELAKEILSLRPDTPIIMATGFSHLVDADKAKAAGIKAFVIKPLTKGEIARTIRSVLDA
jgi:PAS domain S-box-containing protein